LAKARYFTVTRTSVVMTIPLPPSSVVSACGGACTAAAVGELPKIISSLPDPFGDPCL
jgi:hypothetical protein